MPISKHVVNCIAIISILVVSAMNISFAQPVISRPVTLLESTHGIVSPFNYNIYKDTRGLVWICSNAGLYLYDGKKIKEYQPDPPESAIRNLQHVHSYFCEDRESNIWFGTWHGISCYIRARDTFKTYLLPDANPTTKFSASGFDSLGHLWFVHDNALFTLNTHTGTMHRMVGIRPKYRNAELQLDQSGNVKYVYCYNRYKTAPGLSVYAFDSSGELVNDTILFVQTQDSIAVSDVHIVNDTSVFIATSQGLFRYHPGKASLVRIVPQNRSFDSVVNAITTYGDTLLIIATANDGYYVFDPKNNSFLEQFVLHSKGEQLRDIPLSMYTDPDGGIWIHLSLRGLAYFHPQLQIFDYYPIEVERGDKTHYLATLGFVELDDQTVLATSINGEAFYIRTNGMDIIEVASCKECPKNIRSMFKDSRGRILLNADQNYLIMDNNRTYTKLTHEDQTEFNIGFFKELPDGRILHRTDGDLYISVHAESAPPAFTRLLAIDTNYEYSHIAVLPDSLVYASVIHQDSLKEYTLMSFDPSQNFKNVRSFPFAWGIRSSAEIPGSEEILVGTMHGPFLYNTSSASFAPINYAVCGKESIWEIYPIDDRKFFLIGEKCASMLDLQNASSTLYGLEHGLGKTGTTWTAFLRHSSGHIWLGHNSGISILDPTRTDIPDLPTRVNINAIRINGQLYQETNPSQISNPNEIQVLQLPYTQNTVSFDFAALSYTDIDAHVYEYRMAGVEDAWVDGARQGFARYVNLPSGNYTFEVRVKDDPRSMHAVHLSIIPPFYARTWFLILVGTLVLMLAYQILKWREQRKQRILQLQFEKQLAIEQERLRISNNLHDDLGSGLSALNLRAQVLAQQTQDPAMKSEVSQLASNTQRLVGQIRETIWTINAQYDTVDSLATRLHEYALDYFDKSGIVCKVKLMPEEVKTVIPGTHRREIYLAFKEALHNIMKHARATEVNIDIALDAGILVIRIQDNGRGFDPQRLGKGMGIQSMTRRMEYVHGIFDLNSDNSGTCITLKYPE